MNFFKKTTLLLTTFILLVVGMAYLSGLFNKYLDDTQLAQTQKPYIVEKLDYLRSFIIPSIEEQSDFNKLLEAEPTAAVTNLSAITTTITQEALQSFISPQDHPLPLLSHFNTGDIGVDEGMTPEYMISLIEEGNHILPSWRLEPYWKQQLPEEYYMNSILRAKELNLPLTFVIDPIEKTLSEDSYYFTLGKSENPNVVDTNGNILEKLSPLGADNLWSEIGQSFATATLMQKIQEWYPNPPLVMFVDASNAPKLNWTELESSQRYINRYGSTTDDNFKRTVIGAQWIEKYRLLHEGVKNNFTSDTWKTNTKFIAYNPIALNIGTSSNWENNATLTNQQFSSWPLTTDGINVKYFTDSTTTSINENIFNINNIPFILDEAYKQNSGFSHQLSIADFNTFDTANKYRGFTQLGLWMTRPNIVREFNNQTNDKNLITPHFQSVIDSIELIHNDDRLQNFWKNGTLVANPTASIEQLLNVPSYYANAKKWFLLDVDVNPAPEWTLDTHIPVYAIALETGVTPNREWLLVVQSFDGDQNDVSVTIPGYQDVLVNASESANLYVIGESTQEQVVAINKSTTNENTDSIYLEPVDIPTYDPTNNTHVLITPTNGNWDESILNDPKKQHFYIEAGDYLSNRITLTTSGTADARRTLSLYNDNDLHPAKLLDSEQASLSLTLDNASYWTIDRISNINDNTVDSYFYSYKFINGSSYNILNRLYMKNYYQGIYLFNNCNNNTIQNSYLNNMSHEGRLSDNVAIALYCEELNVVNILNNKIINNDIRNALDGIQLIVRNALYNINYSGTVIDSNRIWVDSEIYTNGDYSINGYNPNGEYMIAENALDIKVASTDIHNPVIITNNTMWGYREVDTTPMEREYSGGKGTAVSAHYNAKNVIFDKNIIFDSNVAFAASDPGSLSYSIENWSVKNNIFANLNLINPADTYTIGTIFVNVKNVEIENNLYYNIQKNNSSPYGFFVYFYDVGSGCTFKNNVVVNSHGTTSVNNHDDVALNNGVSIIDIDNNYFFASTETLDGTNTHTYSTSEEAKLEPQSFIVSKFKKLKTIELNVKTSDTSPYKSLFVGP